MKGLHTITYILLVIGGLNWLLLVLDWEIGEKLLQNSQLANILYVLIGLSAIYELINHKRNCKLC